MAQILVINSGSSSIKFQLLGTVSGTIAASGLIEKITLPMGAAHIKVEGVKTEWEGPIPNHEAGMNVLNELFGKVGLELSEHNVQAVGHRVVQGGSTFPGPTLIDDAVRDEIWELGKLAPLHNYGAVDGINGAKKLLPNLPHVAIFDTSFFSDLPASSRNYAIDPALAKKHSVYRFGAHGTSHDFVSSGVAEFLARPIEELRTVVLHLGNGASASAVKGGRPIDTSMGLTPLEGLVMGTRTGDIDPSVYIHLHRVAGMSAEDIDAILNKQSGMKGMCGFSDFRDIHDQIAQGNDAARVALEVYTHRLKKYIGSYTFLMGGVDVIAFTAGIGENDPAVRAAALEGAEGLGIRIDPDRNAQRSDEPFVISADDSQITVVVFPTNEELSIARQTVQVAGI